MNLRRGLTMMPNPSLTTNSPLVRWSSILQDRWICKRLVQHELIGQFYVWLAAMLGVDDLLLRGILSYSWIDKSWIGCRRDVVLRTSCRRRASFSNQTSYSMDGCPNSLCGYIFPSNSLNELSDKPPWMKRQLTNIKDKLP